MPWPLTAALLLPALPTMAASFLPGQAEPDPPTGDTAAPAPAAGTTAAAGPGIRWVFAPWYVSGTLSLDGRWNDVEGVSTVRQGLMLADLNFASYLWQPWFLQVRAGLGAVVATGSSSGEGGGSDSRNQALTGSLGLSLFPASRFPFEFRADVSDSRSSADTIGTDHRSWRVSARQSYRPEQSSDQYDLSLQHSRVEASDGRSDRLSLLQMGLQSRREAHTVELDFNGSQHRRDEGGGRTSIATLSARHDWRPGPDLDLNTLASWNRIDQHEGLASRGLDFDSDVRQIVSVASWRPASGRQSGSLNVGGSARLIEARSGGGFGRQRVRAFSLTLGASERFGDSLFGSASGSYAIVDDAQRDLAQTAGLAASLGWAPTALPWGDWRYTPQAQTSVAASDGSLGGSRHSVGAQASHGLGREFDLGDGSRLGGQLTQALATLAPSDDVHTTDLAHALSLYWQASGDGSSQRYAALSLSDSRQIEGERGSFQLVNLQLNQRTQMSRRSSLSVDLTLQASRSRSTRPDAFTGEPRRADDGWQQFHSGTFSFETQRAFDVPRLRYALLLNATSTRLERRELGDIDAPLEHVSASMEHRLDYTIGRLDARLSARVTRIEGRQVAGLFARVQRRF